MKVLCNFNTFMVKVLNFLNEKCALPAQNFINFECENIKASVSEFSLAYKKVSR